MMKKNLYVLLILSMVGFILLNIVSAKDEPDLFKMASILEDENMIIHKWSLNAREILETVQTKQEAENKVNQLKEQFPNWDWSFSDDDEKWEAKAVFTPKKDVNESIRILSTVTKARVQTYIVYEVTGKGWNEGTKNFIEGSISKRMNDIFHGKSTIFSCVYSDFGDKMNESLPGHVNQLLKAFQAQEIESLEEDSFISTTAYSPLFEEKIQTMTDEMNLQLGVRKQRLGGKTTLVVGTPIITVEY
jgi:hypothetical protein